MVRARCSGAIKLALSKLMLVTDGIVLVRGVFELFLLSYCLGGNNFCQALEARCLEPCRKLASRLSDMFPCTYKMVCKSQAL
jgi:hypothetical protein